MDCRKQIYYHIHQHFILLDELKLYGIDKTNLGWFAQQISDRLQSPKLLTKEQAFLTDIDVKWNPARIKNRAFINDSDLLKDIKDISENYSYQRQMMQQ